MQWPSLAPGREASQHIRELPRAAERDAVASGDLIGSDPQALGDDSAHEVGREEPILSAQHEPRQYHRPRVEWPRAVVCGVRFGALLAQGLLGKGAGDVVVEDHEGILAAGLAAVAPGLLLNSLSIACVVPR